ncbi:uncharacterized protein BDR25DRAFT_355698 [Lindgomyces ingoldianus]|uniref:Uncharacterized protein n=1 Tax=Lindgomyces ingoldianus TaxID=673940 RepID=A0ACB6QUL3_9PLEO|nr:uncharacterized protein BDR25DRAFT_355698 [Lindgomyces ingoldianus]KAF2469977.1 hypothetical protein BDR25DRAFT_355698 [Lindgomyces ingoldianus]
MLDNGQPDYLILSDDSYWVLWSGISDGVACQHPDDLFVYAKTQIKSSVLRVNLVVFALHGVRGPCTCPHLVEEAGINLFGRCTSTPPTSAPCSELLTCTQRAVCDLEAFRWLRNPGICLTVCRYLVGVVGIVGVTEEGVVVDPVVAEPHCVDLGFVDLDKPRLDTSTNSTPRLSFWGD